MSESIVLTLDSTGTVLTHPLEETKTELGNVFNRTVIWTIGDRRIKSFKIEGKSTTGYYPFGRNPNPNQGIEQELTVKPLRRSGEWEYKIIWIDQSDVSRTLDPKIAVNPVGWPFLFFAALIVTIIPLLCIRLYKKFTHKKS